MFRAAAISIADVMSGVRQLSSIAHPMTFLVAQS